jgi:hypothetical protein
MLYENSNAANIAHQGAPNCKISAVTSRSNRVMPDVVGLTSLYNACPIGNWNVSVHNAFTGAMPTTLSDVQLDLYLSVLQS